MSGWTAAQPQAYLRQLQGADPHRCKLLDPPAACQLGLRRRRKQRAQVGGTVYQLTRRLPAGGSQGAVGEEGGEGTWKDAVPETADELGYDHGVQRWLAPLWRQPVVHVCVPPPLAQPMHPVVDMHA